MNIFQIRTLNSFSDVSDFLLFGAIGRWRLRMDWHALFFFHIWHVSLFCLTYLLEGMHVAGLTHFLWCLPYSIWLFVCACYYLRLITKLCFLTWLSSGDPSHLMPISEFLIWRKPVCIMLVSVLHARHSPSGILFWNDVILWFFFFLKEKRINV